MTGSKPSVTSEPRAAMTLMRRLARVEVVPSGFSLLAATALHHDLVLVTRNVRDVAHTGVRRLNPFS